MPRKTKIVGFSLPTELYFQLEHLLTEKRKTRSGFLRELIDFYLATGNTLPFKSGELAEIDLAKALRGYWNLKSRQDLKVLVIGLAIICDKQGKVLIGSRKEKDQWVENLSWVFPGGKMGFLDFEKSLKQDVKKETGLNIKVNDLIAARIHPDSGLKPVQIVALYFHCQPLKEKPIAKPGGDLSKLQWVKPTDVFKHFTTSVCDEVTRFLTILEKSSHT